MIRISEHIIYENDDLIVLNKPAGLLSIPDREGKEISLKAILQEKFGQIFTVHRLDRNTSGVIVYAKHEKSHKDLSAKFESRQTEKYYAGLVIGAPTSKSGSVDGRIAEHSVKRGMMIIHQRGKEALTDYEVISDFGIYSLMRFRIHTGRTHQIRIHMKEIGHPLACDELYGDGKPILLSTLKSKFKLSKDELEERPILNRLALHAQTLRLIGINGEKFEWEAPLPKDMRATIQQLEKWRRK
jgi:23S rRNA pseudouridine955/2504/2580 synthase/23S rRNA pseudouridine1911/1915/1917 synthase